jgi:hypothetical protein
MIEEDEMRRYLWCACVALALAATHAPAWAGTHRHRQEHEQERDGFWIGFGVGYGSAAASVDDIEGGGRDGSLTGHLRLGGTLGDKTLLGCEVNAWTRSVDDVTVTVGNVSAALYYYPMSSSGFFVKGGAGFGVVNFETSGWGTKETVSGVGPGLIFGAGYDHRIGRRTSLTPQATFYAGWPGDLKLADNRVVSTGFKHNVLEVSLGITFH